MKTTKPVRWISVTIACPPAAVYGFAIDARNLPLWAAGLATGIEPDGELWRLGSGGDSARLRWASPNAYGVLDHTVFLADGSQVFVPLRVVPNGEGSEVVFGLYREPSMDDDAFVRDAALVEADLRTLKMVVEERAAKVFGS